MEAMLAAYGSGAATLSNAAHQRILHIDIGGGTTKLAVVEHGKVVATAAVHVGGRLQVVEGGRIVRLDPAGKHHAGRAGFAWDGDGRAERSTPSPAALADLVAALMGHPPPPMAHLYLTDRMLISAPLMAPVFGGVGEPSMAARTAISATSALARPRDQAADRCRGAAMGCCRRVNASRHRAGA
jgi:ethanolamine utilization protein EutA